MAAVGLVRPPHRMAAGEGERGHRVHQAARWPGRPGGRGLGRGVTEYTGVVLGWSVRPSHRMAAGAARRPGREVTEYTGGDAAGLREWSSDGGGEALTKTQSPQSEK